MSELVCKRWRARSRSLKRVYVRHIRSIGRTGV